MSKITLIVVMLWAVYPTVSTTSTTATGSVSTVCIGGPCTSQAYQDHRKIKIPMPDLQACRDARKQFDGIPDVISATCDTE